MDPVQEQPPGVTQTEPSGPAVVREIEAGDDVGYYEEKQTLTTETCYTVPGYGTICAQPGDYYYPKAIEVSKGENRDASNANEPYWIMYRNDPAPIPKIYP